MGFHARSDFGSSDSRSWKVVFCCAARGCVWVARRCARLLRRVLSRGPRRATNHPHHGVAVRSRREAAARTGRCPRQAHGRRGPTPGVSRPALQTPARVAGVHPGVGLSRRPRPRAGVDATALLPLGNQRAPALPVRCITRLGRLPPPEVRGHRRRRFVSGRHRPLRGQVGRSASPRGESPAADARQAAEAVPRRPDVLSRRHDGGGAGGRVLRSLAPCRRRSHQAAASTVVVELSAPAATRPRVARCRSHPARWR